MSINKIVGIRMNQVVEPQQKFRVGQIVEGKILKLYPNNKAQILLGMQKMTAQLEANLLVGEKYHFQVQSTGNVIPLKVIGEALTSHTKTNAIRLLKHLSLKTTKDNVAFVQQLLDSNITFNKAQLIDALQLLDSKKNDEEAQKVLTEMFSRKSPINRFIFEALQTVDSMKQTDLMKNLLNQLRKNNVHSELVNQLSQLIEKPTDINASLVKQINTNKQPLFQLFTSLGLINQNTDFFAWESAWKSLSNGIEQLNVKQGIATDLPRIDTKLPFNLNFNTILQSFTQLNMNQAPLLSQADSILQSMDTRLNHAISTSSSLPEEDFRVLKQALVQGVVPLLGKETGQAVIGLENDFKQIGQVQKLLYLLSNLQTFEMLEEVLFSINKDHAFLSATPQKQFQQQLTQALLLTGLFYENQIANEQVQQQATIKEMLIQLLQTDDGSLRESSSKLLHFINGMQINSVQESANFIQASLQIPAEKLGLNYDIELEFESRKTETGQINPEFCRILFYLNLAKLKETVIDMNIQKRSVSITVFNDYDQIKTNTDAYQPLLRKGLEELDYHLSSISIKPLSEKEQVKTKLVSYKKESLNGGVDYRI
ncbi:hypothetical protein [Oceanobacillus chungangensis]|uniref:Flagellar hook-length control protein-like C-terminal domain-containing protein n=1 Tax=Oceanobacillus chungangensis TaxID=1229152 RepID=A0A3D8PRD8_9BACI|nr:hypothetical protein [Oceanobacillus chungangensis]RDW17851.1 hypothetical protein CWR45_10995 [Oceanobacillus chungangensis]